jgi:hypothetical protein
MFGALGALILLIALGAAPRSTTLEAEQLVIRDSGGRARIIIGQAAPRMQGWPTNLPLGEKYGLFICDEAERELAHLAAEGGMSGLQLMSPDERSLVELHTWRYFKGQSSKSDPGASGAILNLWSQADATQPGAQVRIVAWDDISGMKRTYSRVTVGVARKTPDDTLPRIQLEWSREPHTAGSSRLSLFDSAETERLTLGHTSLTTTGTGEVRERAESSAVLFDRDGKVLWATP